ncbi:MAG: PadR family transcriptional regulator [Candidatus Gracilibacteria bacterium]|nr:PadR family transcriptional regulator [Candidatus Gracilibacteria bacterium]
MSLELISKISSQMRKGILEFLILSIISKGESYASDIIEKLKKNKLIVVEGTLYPLLSRLKKDGFISYYWIESNQGPPRKYYKLTPQGTEALSVMQSVWSNLEKAAKNLTK